MPSNSWICYSNKTSWITSPTTAPWISPMLCSKGTLLPSLAPDVGIWRKLSNIDNISGNTEKDFLCCGSYKNRRSHQTTHYLVIDVNTAAVSLLVHPVALVHLCPIRSLQHPLLQIAMNNKYSGTVSHHRTSSMWMSSRHITADSCDIRIIPQKIG